MGVYQGVEDFDIHNVVRIRTNVRIVPRLPPYFRVATAHPDFEVRGVHELARPAESAVRGMVGYPPTCDLGGGEVFYESPLPFLHYVGAATGWRFRLKGLAAGDASITMTLPFSRLGPMGLRLTDLASRIVYTILGIKLTRSGHVLCHAAATAAGDRAFLFFAYGGTGKTQLTTDLMDSACDGFLSDDYALVDRAGRVFCWPEASPPHSRERGTPGLRYLLGRYRTTSEVRFPIRDRAKAAALFFLERGEDRAIEIDGDEAIRRVTLLNMEEVWRLWNSPATQIIGQYAYFYPDLDLSRLMDEYRSCIASFVDSGARSFVVRSRAPGFPMVRDLITRLQATA